MQTLALLSRDLHLYIGTGSFQSFKTFQTFQSLTHAAAGFKTFQSFKASRQFKFKGSTFNDHTPSAVPGFREFLKARNEQQDLIFFFVEKKEYT